ncbi:MAG: diguanylate cyclase domain-containing protein [Marinobacter sp.]
MNTYTSTQHQLSASDLSRVFEASPSPQLILTPTLHIVTANQAYLDATMTRLDQIVGRGLFEVFPDNPEDPLASGTANLKSSLEQVLKTRKRHQMGIQKYDVRRPPESGGEFEERWWTPVNKPVLDENNEILYIIHRVEDVTEFIRHDQKHSSGQSTAPEADSLKAELITRDRELTNTVEQLRETNEQFQLLADNITQLAWMADSNGSIYWYNQRWFDFTGTTLDEMAGWGWQKVHHPEHVQGVVEEITHCFKTGTPWEDTFPLRGADGQYRWFLSRAVPQRDASGRIVRWFGTNTDITSQLEKEQELRKFKHFSDHAHDMFLVLDQKNHILYANKSACVRLGYPEKKLQGLSINEIEPPGGRQSLQSPAQANDATTTAVYETIYQCRNGELMPVEVSISLMEQESERRTFITCRGIAERKRIEADLRERALHDPLTGLPNRAMVMEFCEQQLASAKRDHGEGAVLFIDLDNFKPINDLYGHDVGDHVLREIANRLKEGTRQEDLVGRLGGDEFIIVVPLATAEHHRAATVAQHVIQMVSEPFYINSLKLTLSPSIGISYFPQDATEVSTLIHAADVAMYHAKQSGRAGYRFYTLERE